VLSHGTRALPETISIDGQAVKVNQDNPHEALLEKNDGKWKTRPSADVLKIVEKKPGVQGPIDDAFRHPFVIITPSGKPMHPTANDAAVARQNQFATLWDRHFRGKLLTLPAGKLTDPTTNENLVLFGDPGSNPVLAKLLPKLPITWTAETLEVNGVKYDPKTHYPAIIYPNPSNPQRYVVINSGHTFGEADLRGTNALLYPRLGDWAVLKIAPTKDNPAAVEVVAAGLFDEKWQFEKKK